MRLRLKRTASGFQSLSPAIVVLPFPNRTGSLFVGCGQGVLVGLETTEYVKNNRTVD